MDGFCFKEGFSAQLVEDLVRELGIEPGGKIGTI